MISMIDYGIIIVYIVGLIVLGGILGKSNKSQEDYFLAGRSMPWLPIGLSVAATMISANGFIGAPGWAYGSGISPYMVNIGVPLAIAIVMFTSIPIFYNLKLTSVYEYVELRLGVVSRMLTVLGFIANSVIQVSSMVFVPALIIQYFTGWSLTLVVPIVVVSAVVYTLLGGIKAVIWTDAIQMVVMWCGLGFSIYYILNSLDMGFFETIAVAKDAGKLVAIDFSMDITRTNAFWATFIGGTIMWIRYFGFDQGQVQRILTSKSMKGVKNSFVVSALIMNILYFLFMILGVMLYVFFAGKEFDSANNVMIEFIAGHLPVGIVGIVVAGVFAAAMSSIDSLLNSMSTVYMKDIHERFFSKEEGDASLRLSMITSAVWGVVIMIFTLLGFSGTSKSVLAVVGSYISYLSGPMCGAFFLALFTRKANDLGVSAGVVIGLVLTYIFATTTGASWIWKPAVGMITTFAFGYLASLLLPSTKDEDDVYQYTVFGQREKLIAENNTTEDGVSILPLHIDKYVVFVFGFFVVQYVFLALIAM